MTVRLVAPHERINVTQICVVEYGQPGARKTSLAQTADDPFTVATDPGIYRAFGRRECALVETWADVLEVSKLPEFEKARTIVYDTLGMTLEKLGAAIVADSPKNGNRLGGLSLQGYGVLAGRFALFVAQLKERGKDIVFVAHEKIERNGDETYSCPEIVGKSYSTIMNISDMVGYMHFLNGKRVIDFAPSDRWMAKCPPWDRDSHIELPDFSREPQFLAKLIAEAKASMGRVSAASAAVASVVDGWQAWLAKQPSIDAVNTKVRTDLPGMQACVKSQVWHLVTDFAQRNQWTFSTEYKRFVTPEPMSHGEHLATEPPSDNPDADAPPADEKKAGKKKGAA